MGNIQGMPCSDGCGIFSTEEIANLKKKFNALDKDKSGTIEPEEFFSVPSLAKNPLVKRVISVFDENGDGKISFEEFVKGLAVLSTGSDDKEKIKFAFQVYDFDNDGYISNGDLFLTLKMMVGDNLSDVQLQQLVDRTIVEADQDFDGLISFPEFEKMVSKLEIAKKLTIKYEGNIWIVVKCILKAQML